MIERECLRRRIIARCKKIICDCDETIRIAEYRNGLPHNQRRVPLDVEWFRVQMAWARRTLAEIEADP